MIVNVFNVLHSIKWGLIPSGRDSGSIICSVSIFIVWCLVLMFISILDASHHGSSGSSLPAQILFVILQTQEHPNGTAIVELSETQLPWSGIGVRPAAPS